MPLNSAMYSSDRSEWRTPDDLFNRLNKEFVFDLDACATRDNTKCERFWTRHDDALQQQWRNSVFMNPPYGQDTRLWLAKAHQEAQEGAQVVVGLIPCRTDSVPWHLYVMKAAEIRLVRGRMQFDYEGRAARENVAPFPSAVVVFRKGLHKPVVSSILRNGERLSEVVGAP